VPGVRVEADGRTGEAMPLTPEQRRDYERAAVALENGGLPDLTGELDGNMRLMLVAYREAWRALRDDFKGERFTFIRYEKVCKAAARLLRECLQRDETLP
jgi:hypothetical protein